MTISDEVFIAELEKHLKAQKLNRYERDKSIKMALILPIKYRDEILEFSKDKAANINKKKRPPSETSEQIEAVAWFKQAYPDIRIAYVHNGGTRSPRERSEQMCLGLLPGYPDLIIDEWGLRVEMKRVKLSRLSKEQEELHTYLRAKCGLTVLVCYGADDFKQQITLFAEMQ